MTLREQYPLIFDEMTIPFYPSMYDRSDNKVSVVNRTEDGHDDVDVVRMEKTLLDVTFLVDARWAGILKTYRRKTSIEVQIYDTAIGDYQTKTMRIEDYSETLEENSDRNTESLGLYTVSFTLEEF